MQEFDWYGLYSEGWSDDIVPDAYSHPAKYARGLIRQIYRHALERGYLQAGDRVVDPFGGVALGSLDAARYGLNWTGVELEEKFVTLGNANIDLWRGRYAPHFPGWGTARLLQGDSRQLCRVIGEAAAVVSSPPYANGEKGHPSLGSVNKDDWGNDGRDIARRRGVNGEYGKSCGQLAELPEGSYSAAIASPPFGEAQSGGGIANALNGDGDYQLSQQGGRFQGYQNGHQAHTTGNLATLKADDTGYAAAISSPPYADQANGWNEGTGARWDAERHPGNPNKRSSDSAYGVTAGNLGHMSACVSSPPYEGCDLGGGGGILIRDEQMRKTHGFTVQDGNYTTDKGNGNIGNDQGETLWSAAALIVGQVYQVLKSGGYTFWVCKDFVRNKKRVPFSDRWQALCEAQGFVPVERIRAWVVEDHGVQVGMFGDDKLMRKERKSFFRRLAEKNGSPRIDWEDVLVMRKGVSL